MTNLVISATTCTAETVATCWLTTYLVSHVLNASATYSYLDLSTWGVLNK